MIETEEHPWKGARYAFAWLKPELVGTKAYSGWGLANIDPDAATLMHAPDISDDLLGEYVCQSLRESMPWSKEKARSLLHDATPYTTWIEELMAFGGYKTRQAVFRKMKRVSIRNADGQIIFMPTDNAGREAFNGIGKEAHLIIPENSTKAEIGAALKQAFERCT